MNTVQELQEYIQTPEGSEWFMNAVDEAIKNKESERTQIMARMCNRDSIDDFQKDMQKQLEREMNEHDKVAEKITVSRSKFEEASKYNRLHNGDNMPLFFRAYLTDDMHLEFIQPAGFGAYMGDHMWFNAWDQIEKVIQTGASRIIDKSVIPYYFDVVLVD